MSHSKQKGSSFERKVCKALSNWITDGVKDDCFWRSSMSGGRATVASRKGRDLRRHAGDISATAPEGHKLTDFFYLECKHYRNLDLGGFLLGKGTLKKFWDIAIREAARYEKQPMLIAKQNHVPTLVIVPHQVGNLMGVAKSIELWHGEQGCFLFNFDVMVSRSFELCMEPL